LGKIVIKTNKKFFVKGVLRGTGIWTTETKFIVYVASRKQWWIGEAGETGMFAK